MFEPQLHSDIKDPNYLSREQEIEAKERAVKLDVMLRLGGIAVLLIVIVLGGILS